MSCVAQLRDKLHPETLPGAMNLQVTPFNELEHPYNELVSQCLPAVIAA